MTDKEFAAQHGISPNLLKQWKRRGKVTRDADGRLQLVTTAEEVTPEVTRLQPVTLVTEVTEVTEVTPEARLQPAAEVTERQVAQHGLVAPIETGSKVRIPLPSFNLASFESKLAQWASAQADSPTSGKRSAIRDGRSYDYSYSQE